MRRGITTGEIKYQLVQIPTVPGYLDARVHSRVATDPTIWGQKNKFFPLKKYSFQSDPIFRSRLVNMVVNRIMKKKH